MLKLPASVELILNQITSHGYEAFVVGGWVRDALLSNENTDIDITTSAKPQIIFDLMKKYKPSNQFQSLGCISFRVENYNIEITTYRKEFDYENKRKPNEVEFVDNLEIDLRRRDFTINAICYNPEVGIIDLFNGQEDLKAGILRTIGEPGVRFNEDILRIVRLVRFKSYLNFEIEKETLYAAQELSPLLATSAVSLWRKEFMKIMTSPYFLRVSLEDRYLFSSLLPELSEAIGFDQLNPYHKYSLYEHTVRVTGCLPSRLDLRLAGLFHDLGKLEVQVIDDEGIGHYPLHSKASSVVAERYCDLLQVSKKDKKNIINFVKYHDAKLKETFDSIYSFAFEKGCMFTRDLIRLKRCDNLAKSEKAAYQVARCDEFIKILDQVEDFPLKVSDLQVKNQDLLLMGVKQESVSKVLNKLLKRSVELNVGNNKALQMELLKGVLEDDIY